MAIKKRKVGPGRFVLLDETMLETDFSCQLTNLVVSWTDEAEDDVEVLCGDVEPGDITWSATAGGTMYQDRDLDGLVQWTWENKGKVYDSVFVANDADGTQVTGKVQVKPLDFGGEVGGTSPTSDFEWPYVGEPAIDTYASS